jgi:hypothetical protein
MQDEDDECHFGWNFGNLTNRPDTTGMTIEWRQPPAVRTADQCLGWTELAVEFVQAAREWENIGDEIGRSYSPDVEGLVMFMHDLGEYPGRDMTLMADIFRDKSGRVKVVDWESRVNYSDIHDEMDEQKRQEFLSD